jgi:cell shape-determining protein MreC
LLEIKFLSSDALLIEGETVETSGHGGRLPPGINVGKVVKGFSGEFYIKPSVDFQRMTYLSIITNKEKISGNYKTFQGFAPLQKPKPSFVFKGLDSSGTRQKGSEN